MTKPACEILGATTFYDVRTSTPEERKSGGQKDHPTLHPPPAPPVCDWSERRKEIAEFWEMTPAAAKRRFWWARLDLRTRALAFCVLLHNRKRIPNRKALLDLVRAGTVDAFPGYGSGTLAEILAALGYTRIRRRCGACGAVVPRRPGGSAFTLEKIKGGRS